MNPSKDIKDLTFWSHYPKLQHALKHYYCSKNYGFLRFKLKDDKSPYSIGQIYHSNFGYTDHMLRCLKYSISKIKRFQQIYKVALKNKKNGRKFIQKQANKKYYIVSIITLGRTNETKGGVSDPNSNGIFVPGIHSFHVLKNALDFAHEVACKITPDVVPPYANNGNYCSVNGRLLINCQQGFLNKKDNTSLSSIIDGIPTIVGVQKKKRKRNRKKKTKNKNTQHAP